MEQKDRNRLRALAAHQLEIANSPKNLERVALWKRHNMCRGERPVIHIEADFREAASINKPKMPKMRNYFKQRLGKSFAF